jgi:hypothetical protein
MRNRIPKDPQSLMNRAIPRQSSSIVVTPEPACHARGREFESCRSPLKQPANQHLLLPGWAQTTAGFWPASRADSARNQPRVSGRKVLQAGMFCRRLGGRRVARLRSSRADPARAIVAPSSSSYRPGGTLDTVAAGGNDQLAWGAALGLVGLYGVIAAIVSLGVFRTRDIIS